jgi:hypothetical protein
MSLSAYLAQATGDAKYTQAAYAAGSWIARANTNAAGLPLDTINGRTCARSDASWVFTYNAGKYVEGLTALYGATRNSSLLAECVSRPGLRAGAEADGCVRATDVAAAGVRAGPWQRADGVITEGAHPDKVDDSAYFKCACCPCVRTAHAHRATAVWVRALNELFRATTNAQLRTLLHSYLVVQVRAPGSECVCMRLTTAQYNALLGLAANGTSYSSAWAGPAQAFTAWGQAAALDNLVVGITSTT